VAKGLGRRLPAAFYARHPLTVAPELLNKVLVHGGRAGRIVEVEAYCGPDDPASHAYRGPTPRTATMFGPAGHLYVYRSYGIHWCANVVTHPNGEVGAVLIRALAPLAGLAEMELARPAARRAVDLTNGPGKLCQALGIVGTDDGSDLRSSGRTPTILGDGTPSPTRPLTGPRVGISRAVDRPWRFSVPGDPHRSKPWT
jgi:DNA-3-methyladenine glycosylase